MTESEAREIVEKYEALLADAVANEPSAKFAEIARLRVEEGAVLLEAYTLETDIDYDGNACGAYLISETYSTAFGANEGS